MESPDGSAGGLTVGFVDEAPMGSRLGHCVGYNVGKADGVPEG